MKISHQILSGSVGKLTTITKKQIFSVLRIIHEAIPKNTPWLVFAGANCVIRGMPIETNDIDIVTTKKGLSTFGRYLKHFLVSINRSGKSLNWEGLDFMIKNIKVEVIFDKVEYNHTHYTQDLKNDRFDVINGVKFLKLEPEMWGYEKTGNQQKAQLIQYWLDKSK